MKCPHCSIAFHEDWRSNYLTNVAQPLMTTEPEGRAAWNYKFTICPACHRAIISLLFSNGKDVHVERQVYPLGSSRGPTPSEVPANIASDYEEACNVLPISAKASAALSRRCLQNMLHAHGYRDRDLAREIDLLLNEKDPTKAIPTRLRETVDAIRHFGNFSAHPIDDKTTLQIIDVEPEEAEWCLETVEEMFDHFYVGPAKARAKKAALDAKLAKAGKPPSK